MTGTIWKTPSQAQVGQLAHRVIADLLRANIDRQRPDWEQVLVSVDERMRRDGYRDRAARQTITAAALAYLSVAPPPPWAFVRAEVTLPGVRFDLLWTHPDTGALMVDEIKTGHGGIASPPTRRQVNRYLHALAASNPNAEVSVRAISARAPAASWTLTPADLDLSPPPRKPARPPPPLWT